MPNYLGQTPAGHLVEDDNGALLHLPDVPAFAVPEPAPAPDVATAAPQEAPRPYVAPDAPREVIAAPYVPPDLPAPADVAPIDNNLASGDQNIIDGYNLQQLAREQARTVDEVQNYEAGQINANRNDDIERLRQQQAAVMSERQQRQQKLMGDVDALENQVVNAKVDQGRLWNNRTTGQKWGLFLSMLASGLGNVLSGGDGSKNMALDYWLKAVDDDVRAQQVDNANVYQRYGLAQKKLGGFDSETDALRNDHDLQVAAVLKASAAKVEEMAARMQPSRQQAATLAAAGELYVKAGEAKQKGLDRHLQEQDRKFGREMQLRNYNAGRSDEGFKRKVEMRKLEQADRKNAIDDMRGQAELQKVVDENNARDLPGLLARNKDGSTRQLRAKTTGEATKLREKISVTNDMAANADELLNILESEGGISSIPSQARNAAQQIQAYMSLKGKDMFGGGAWDNGMERIMGRIAGGDVSGWQSFVTSAKPGIERFRKKIIDGLANDLKAQDPEAIIPVFERTRRDAPATENEKLQRSFAKAAEGPISYLSSDGKTGQGVPNVSRGDIALPVPKKAFDILSERFDMVRAGGVGADMAMAELRNFATSATTNEDARQLANYAVDILTKTKPNEVSSLASAWQNRDIIADKWNIAPMNTYVRDIIKERDASR